MEPTDLLMIDPQGLEEEQEPGMLAVHTEDREMLTLGIEDDLFSKTLSREEAEATVKAMGEDDPVLLTSDFEGSKIYPEVHLSVANVKALRQKLDQWLDGR